MDYWAVTKMLAYTGIVLSACAIGVSLLGLLLGLWGMLRGWGEEE